MKIAAAKFPTKGIWLVALAVAAASCVPIALLTPTAPWAITFPIAVGVSIIAWLELSRWDWNSAELPFVRMPSNFRGLSHYKRHVVLSFQESQQNQPELFGLFSSQQRKATKLPRIIKDPDGGGDMYLIDSERFVTLLVNKMLTDADKAAEASLRIAIARHRKMHGIGPDLERFLNDRTVLDVIKSDFRSNTVQALNRSGESIIRQLVKQAKEDASQRLNL